ncbi:hypothetical protein SUNI508_09072 [Seiridium unicorne]|uniref:pH-response regulator protein palC n=1 Tax=Seiridium unicorne TaxID=138068 RepID=A0ABR2URB2_9PEZI
MPFPFVLPTTSSFSFSSSFTCDSHPSLPLNASTHRGVVRDALKKHKRLSPASQPPHLPSVVSNINSYLQYLFAFDAGLKQHSVQGHEISAVPTSAPAIEWRPTLSDNAVPGKEQARVKIQSLEYELFFSLSALGYAHTNLARAALHPLYVTSGALVGSQERTTAIQNATKHLLDAASVHDFLARRAESLVTNPPCADISASTTRALASLALAEATLLAVLKDDPYPAIIAQDRNKNDREWMYKAPEIPKVRAHLFARLCLAASDHAAQASALCKATSKGTPKLNESLVRYVEDFQKTARAKACRFFGIDAELSGQTGNALGWLQCGLQELGVEPKEAKKGLSLTRMKKEWTEKREDKKVEKAAGWGSDAGKLEESRVLEMLHEKWSKVNDTMMTQAIPAPATLLASLPSGREIHNIKPYIPPELSRQSLEAIRAPPDRVDDYGDGGLSSDEETLAEAPVGAFPGTQGETGYLGERVFKLQQNPTAIPSVGFQAMQCNLALPQPDVKRDITENCTDIQYRVPWTSLTQDEKSSYIQADLCLITAPSTSGVEGAKSRWDDLHWPHIYQTVWVHGVGAFLPFHRYYMKVHEDLIREECGYTGRMPFWDELADIDSVIADLDMFKDEYFGGDGTGTNNCIESGAFVNMSLAFGPNDADADGGHCVFRNFSEQKLQQAAQSNIDECMAIDDYTSAWSCWANAPHGAGHGGIGGLMGDPTYSPGDPGFYLHHSYLDKLWWEWQKADYPARLTDMGGPNIPKNTRASSPGYPPTSVTDYFGDDGTNTTTLNHNLWMMGIAPNVTIGDVMNLKGPTICVEYLDE